MIRRNCYLAVLALASWLLPHSGAAQDQPARIALLIGNARYAEMFSPLRTTLPDIGAVADEIRHDGFEVDQKENLGAQEMAEAMRAFMSKIQPGTSVLFYFSGYGVEAGRQTFLIPIDAQISNEDAVRRDGINLDEMLAQMKRRGAKVKIVIIDAARRNPYEFHIRTSPAGLSGIDPPEGTIAMYSTSPGKLVTDGTGMTSIFIAELIKEMRSPDQSIENIFNRTRIAVARATNNEQVPWIATSLAEPFYMKAPGAGVPATAAAPQVAPPAAPSESQLERAPSVPSTISQPPTRTESAQAEPSGAARRVISSGQLRTHALSTAGVRALNAGDRFSECSKCPELVTVPSGNFIMGSPEDEPGRIADEGPQRSVFIGRKFAVGEIRHFV